MILANKNHSLTETNMYKLLLNGIYFNLIHVHILSSELSPFSCPLPTIFILDINMKFFIHEVE